MDPLLIGIGFAASLFILAAIVNESGGFATFVFIVAAIAMLLVGPGWYWPILHARELGIAVLIYLTAGAFYGCGWKWYMYNRKQYKVYKEHEAMLGYDNKPKYSKEKLHQLFIPKFRQEKERILTWMVFWPWSMVASLFQDVLREIFLGIQRLFYGVMESITNHVFKDVK